ncbi:hypothetical protein Dsin_019837 [Dipteronia sinensis]|uniref:Uncharacterized protein n=1 Tax=Dipteronia sinensis TaxID=43782 RepID=A0AAE0A865_9ROSI|nr:hypothetical protein Dsin_019837 [Dipteronia sinensis]
MAQDVSPAAHNCISSSCIIEDLHFDDVVMYMYKFGEKSFQNVTFNGHNGLGHYTIPEEMDEVCAWLTSKLES